MSETSHMPTQVMSTTKVMNMEKDSLLHQVRRLASLRRDLTDHLALMTERKLALEAEITAQQTSINRIEAGLDIRKIEVAESIIVVRGDYLRSGDERGSVRKDAIRWFSGEDMGHKDLRAMFFGTKSYDRWHGQRCDCSYGYGPSHGSIIFAIGLAEAFRKPEWCFTEEQQEAAIYYLVHLEAIQKARADAK